MTRDECHEGDGELFVIPTGNHLFFDAAAGAAVAVVSLGTAALAPRVPGAVHFGPPAHEFG